MGVRLTIETNAEGYEPERVVLELDQPRITLGRATSCDVLLPHPSVSTQHATLRQSGTGYGVVDERSTNGVRVGDERLPPERAKPLRSGDVIRIGPYRLAVTLGIPVPRATTADEATALARRLVLRKSDALGTASPRSLAFANGPRAGERLALPEETAELRVGRAEDAEVSLDDSECSRHHATLIVEKDTVVVRDEGSKNGVLVQGKPITTRRLRDRDELLIGATVLVFEDAREAAIVTNAKLVLDEAPPEEAKPRADGAGTAEAASMAGSTGSGDAIVDEAAGGLEVVEIAPPKPRTEAKRPAPTATADRLIYGLAILVLGLSVAAIAWLFGSH